MSKTKPWRHIDTQEIWELLYKPCDCCWIFLFCFLQHKEVRKLWGFVLLVLIFFINEELNPGPWWHKAGQTLNHWTIPPSPHWKTFNYWAIYPQLSFCFLFVRQVLTKLLRVTLNSICNLGRPWTLDPPILVSEVAGFAAYTRPGQVLGFWTHLAFRYRTNFFMFVPIRKSLCLPCLVMQGSSAKSLFLCFFPMRSIMNRWGWHGKNGV